MKKFLFVLSMIILSLAACTKREEPAPKPTASELVGKHYISNQFEYNATENIQVMITEFTNDFEKQCVVVHANHIYDSSQADVTCIDSLNEPLVKYEKNEIVKQFTYDAKGTPVQVTMIRTKNNHTCTIIHANYLYDSSTATISC